MKRSSKFRYSSPLLRESIAFIDVLAIVLAGQACLHWYPGGSAIQLEMGNFLSGNYYLLESLAGLLMLAVSGRVYRLWRGGALLALLGRALLSWGMAWMLVMVWLVLTKSATDFSRIWLVSWLVGGMGFLCLARMIIFLVLSQLARYGYNQQSVLLIGSSQLKAQIRKRVKTSSWAGYEVIGSLRPNKLQEIAACVERYEPDEIWIGLELTDKLALNDILATIRHSTANVRLIPDMFTLQVMNHGSSMVMGYPMLDISHSPMHGANVVIKAVLDYVFAAFAVVAISPIMLLIAILIRLDSPGPIIFKQKRHGWNGKIIEVYKFRSMVAHQPTGDTVMQATRGDSRITKIGAFLRRTSLDELPQFINVLQGRLAVVGPRPHAVTHNEEYRELVPRYMLRHKVKPGITGWAQINGFRGETDTLDKMEKRVEYDLHYIENWSIWLDCYIIFMTVFKGFINKNAY